MNQKRNRGNGKFVFVKPLILMDFASRIQLDPSTVIKYFFIKGKPTTLNTVLSKGDCMGFCSEFKIDFSEGQEDEDLDQFFKYLPPLDPKEEIPKIPIVTIMGHVDHGKTTLLDRIRGSKVADKEFGGITQHIGAYQIERDGQRITFLDTPGHKAFTKIRSRGAKVTDIVVLVVAADDGIKQQTVEAIQHALAAKVKIIVFINKIDKGAKNIGELKNSLMNNNLVIEEFGGDVVCVEGSALTGQGVDNLLDSILLVSEVSELKTTKSAPAFGTVVESRIDKGMGISATVILERGTLKCGDFLSIKSSVCKIRSMINENGTPIVELDPATPAFISGFREMIDAGDRFLSFPNESEAKKFASGFEKREQRREAILIEKNKDLKEINIIVKADVSGSLEAVKDIIHSFNINIIASSVGQFTEVDLQLASTTNSLIINFNQKISLSVINRAKEMKITVRNYRSVYELEDDLTAIIENNRIVEYEETVLGRAQVLKLWYHSKVGTIAGCKVIEGKIEKTNRVKVIRNQEVLTISTIKSFKTEDFAIKECSLNQECGIVVNNWNDIREGDVIEAFQVTVK